MAIKVGSTKPIIYHKVTNEGWGPFEVEVVAGHILFSSSSFFCFSSRKTQTKKREEERL